MKVTPKNVIRVHWY